MFSVNQKLHYVQHRHCQLLKVIYILFLFVLISLFFTLKIDKVRPLTAPEVRPSTKEKEKVPIVDPNNDNSRHWLTYPNPKTPQYIIDIRQRLGQLKIPLTLARPSSASSASAEQKPPTPATSLTRPSSASTPIERKKEINNDDQQNFLTCPTRETPDDLRAMRYRLDKHRYNATLDNYPPRPKTCPVNVSTNQKPITPKPIENQVKTPKNDVWTVEDEKPSNLPDYESQSSSSLLIQVVDCDGLPNEYYEALEIANAAQEEYLRNLKKEPERRPENPVYRIATAPLEHRNDLLVSKQSFNY